MGQRELAFKGAQRGVLGAAEAAIRRNAPPAQGKKATQGPIKRVASAARSPGGAPGLQGGARGRPSSGNLAAVLAKIK